MSDIKMRGPEGCADSVSFDGQSYPSDKKGIFTLPAESHAHFVRHGFKVVGEVKDAEADKP